ncbi:hypothetical protein GSI_09587 [Ganoderma sinense ZZ0214-1]|uniref:Uncharacterized protein n=1 Tax=Ganoderma sinense ZZ0214-1 TaxID=1077348 RepID=A0A2G8S409_9APHY|nr:hypothetical protein GSI_09587 [Ganoderma sinense ZZ0214-1]
MRALLLLVESGTVYSIFLTVAVAYNGVSRSRSARTSDAQFVTATRTFLTACFAPILAIYPTIIIFVVALNRSLIDNDLANPASGIPSSIAFRSSPSAVHLTLPPGGANFSHSDHSLDSPGNQPIQTSRTQEKSEETAGLV